MSIDMSRKNSALLAARLTKELVDENLMQRYGTSIDVNMGREYQKFLDKKYHDLKAEFEKIDKNQDENLTIEELLEFVNSYSKDTGRKFTTDYVTKLFNLIDKDHDKKLTIQEFVESYIILEEKLKLKKIKLSKLDDDLRIAKEKFQKGMNDNKGETVNSEDVSSTASLYVTLLHAKDLKPMDMNGSSNPYVIFKLGTQKATSSFKPSTLEPIWNEDFSFPVNTKNLDLLVEVWTHGRFGGEEIQGKLKIPLKDLANQMKVERDFELEGENGTITLRLQFLYSKYKYYSSNFIKTEGQILRLQEDIHELNRYYDLFHIPFGILIYGEINSILDKKILQRSEDIASYAATSRRSVYMSPNFLKAPKGFAFKLESVIKGTFRKSNVEWSYYSLVMMYSVLICSAVSLIGRSDFVGLFVGVALWILFINDKNKMDILKYLKLLLYTILFTIIYDSAWLAIHYNNYWKGLNQEKKESSLRTFTYLLALINFASKIVLVISLWVQYHKAIFKKDNSLINENSLTSNNDHSTIQIGNTYQS